MVEENIIQEGGLTIREWRYMWEREPQQKDVTDWALYMKDMCERKACHGDENDGWTPCKYFVKTRGRCLFETVTGSAPVDWKTPRPSGLQIESDEWDNVGSAQDQLMAAAKLGAPWPKDYTLSKILKYTTIICATSKSEAINKAAGEVFADKVEVVHGWVIEEEVDPDEETKADYLERARRDEEDADD